MRKALRQSRPLTSETFVAPTRNHIGVVPVHYHYRIASIGELGRISDLVDVVGYDILLQKVDH